MCSVGTLEPSLTHSLQGRPIIVGVVVGEELGGGGCCGGSSGGWGRREEDEEVAEVLCWKEDEDE